MGLGYKKISKGLFIPKTATASIVEKYKLISAETKRTFKSTARQNGKNFCESLNQDTPPDRIWKKLKDVRQNGKNFCESLNQDTPPDRIWKKLKDVILEEPLYKLAPYSTELNFRSEPQFNHTLCEPFNYEELERALKNNSNTRVRTAKKILLSIFNKIFLEEEEVQELKAGIIIPITKPGKHVKSPSDLRPITMLSCTLKTLERLIKFRLDWWTEKYNSISEQQFGFRQGRSTYDALTHLVTDIETTFTKNNYLIAVFIDVQKAYNKVDLQTLRLKLESIKVPPNIAAN
ncbi:Reverse transcriptase (RNA-dependent DNA polymerase) [Popillia japonica]|uniref:Reverse transcriptase (RNA-dependent DNA polymerase) n=1 Tax=Popillia japonica TaxID=7064 RepID=A0AAW1KKP5_POPJA